MNLLMNNLRYVLYIIFIAYRLPFAYFLSYFLLTSNGLNLTTTFSRALEKTRKIKHFTDIAKAVSVYCRGR